MCIHTSQAGLCLVFGRRLLFVLGEQAVAGLVFAPFDRNIIVFSVQNTYTNNAVQFHLTNYHTCWITLHCFYATYHSASSLTACDCSDSFSQATIVIFPFIQ